MFQFSPITCLNWSIHRNKNYSSLPFLADFQEELQTQSIPASLRRRCSGSSKIALSLALLTLKNETADYYVFCSQHGEMDTTVSLLKELSEATPLSPAGFSQSVHNTAAGLLSMVLKSRAPSVSLCAREGSFLAGMLEASVWLEKNPGKKVLLVMYDVTPPKPYDTLNLTYNDEYGVALLLTQHKVKEKPQITLSLIPGNNKANAPLPPALVFLNWYLSAHKNTLEQSYYHQKLLWSYHD